MSDLPNTSDSGVVLAAIAWEIVQQSHEGVMQDKTLTQQEKLEHLVNDFIEAYVAIENREMIDAED